MNKIKVDDVVDDLLLILQHGEENESILDDHVELQICWPHTLLNFVRNFQVNKRYEK